MSNSPKPWETIGQAEARLKEPPPPPATPEMVETVQDVVEKARKKRAPRIPKKAPEINNATAKFTEDQLNPAQKVLMDSFVYEYLHDFNAHDAYIRASGAEDACPSTAHRMLKLPYVQKQLRQISELIQEDVIVTRNEVMMGLKKEANYFGVDGSASSRVRAWTVLAKIKGMEAPTKVEQEVTHKGGVMIVPMAATTVDWEDVAQASQLQLKHEVRN